MRTVWFKVPTEYNLIEVLFAIYLQFLFEGHDMWSGTFSAVRDNLRYGIQVCTKWIQVCKTLTGQFWKNYHLHQWKGEDFSPEKLSMLGKRLEEVITLGRLFD